MLLSFHDLLARLAKTPSSNDKIDLISSSLSAKPELARLFELALSPYITFGVAKLPRDHVAMDHAHLNLTWDGLLKQLADRKLTGNAALAEIAHMRRNLAMQGPAQVEAFDRILLKDLRCGIAAETVNKACPGIVSVFSCQLAPSKMPKLSELKFPIFAEPKYDGVRTIAIKINGTVKLFSRNGIEFENFVELANALTALRDGTVLDGEVVSSKGFSALMTRAKAKTGTAVDVPLQYRVFDGMSSNAWGRQLGDMSLEYRRGWVKAAVGDLSHSMVTMSPQVRCENMEEVETFYREQLALGLEGIMLKDPLGFYTFKRNKNWMKLKPFETADLKVVSLIEGKERSKYAGMMGAILCEGEHDGKPVLVEVGSGFSDEQRKHWWETRHAAPQHDAVCPVGRIAEIRFQEMSLAQGSDVYSLRFPSFVRWRDDK